MNQQLLQEYNKYRSHDQKRLAATKKKIRQLAYLRLVAFLAVVLSLIYLAKNHPLIAYPIAISSTILFFYWIRLFQKKEKEKTFNTNLIDINQKEIQALQEDYSPFDDGREFIDPHHPFTFDLDIFGAGSVFQMINRTVTQLGGKKLADYLIHPLTKTEQIKSRQKALLELAKYTRWRQFFAARGKSDDEQDLKLIRTISKNEAFPNAQKLRWQVILLPIISLSCLLLSALNILPWGYFLVAVSLNGAVMYSYRKIITRFYQGFGNQSNMLHKYKEILQQIEEKEFESDQLKALKQQLLTHDKTASLIIGELRQAMARFDYRGNLVFAMLFEPLIAWDLICVYQLNQWQLNYQDSVHQWFDVMAEFDALSSLANLNHNQPDWTLPKVEDREFHLTANDLKHPLIKSAKNIGNDFHLDGLGQIAIITGANMAGKSTFLRTVGVNMILAMNGCRACASWLSLKPVQLFTNMRTTDNLQNDESYFFAELQRLKAILDTIKSGNEVFVIIDEMLKGTNSEDKLSGSMKLIDQLLSLHAVGMVATHDLKLTSLAEKHPHKITNKCFEIQLSGDDLVFDYRLTDGVTTTMNANFLMKKMGIISE
ncbi:MAG TPA: hypothetical protein VKA27_18250 [Sunxiuqinia sp.]|nr:hypothetical protein [Sunxiuqinia sp.]